jgi:hypothetical protein
MDTPPEAFNSWDEYILFCQSGPKVVVRFNHFEHHRFSTTVSKKLLVDFSPTLAEDLQHDGDGLLTFDSDLEQGDPIIDPKIFMALYNMMVAGGVITRVTGGREKPLLTLVRMWELADHFKMDVAKTWIRHGIDVYLGGLRRTVQINYDHANEHVFLQVNPLSGTIMPAPVLPPTPVRADIRNRVLDLGQTWEYLRLRHLDNRIIKISDINKFLITYCPLELMLDCLDGLVGEPRDVWEMFLGQAQVD